MLKNIKSRNLSLLLVAVFFSCGVIFCFYNGLIDSIFLMNDFHQIARLKDLSHKPSTEVLKKNFFSHKNEFEKLKNMILADKLPPLDDTGRLHTQHQDSKVIPKERLEAYLQLMKTCRIKCLGYSKKTPQAYFEFWSVFNRKTKGYCYFPKPDALLEYKRNPKYIPLDSNWHWFVYEYDYYCF